MRATPVLKVVFQVTRDLYDPIFLFYQGALFFTTAALLRALPNEALPVVLAPLRNRSMHCFRWLHFP